MIWSVVAFALEVPSGALADAWSRRGLYAVGEFVTAAGYALWLLWPAFPGFALGFVLWGVGGALSSGTLEALVYDELVAEGRSGDYARVAGRGGTVAILAMFAATLLATPAFAAGGYRLVGIASVATVTLGGLLALSLPARSRTDTEGDNSIDGSYAVLLRTGVREATRSRRLLRAVAIAALLPGFSALDEYLPLLARDKGSPTATVPLLFALTALAMAAGSALAGSAQAASAQADSTQPRNTQINSVLAGSAQRCGRLPIAAAAAALLLAVGALLPHISGMVAISGAFGLLQFATVRAEADLQERISGPARSTVLSVSGFAAEVFAVALYAWFALELPLPVLFALCAIPLLMTAAAAGGNRPPRMKSGPPPPRTMT